MNATEKERRILQDWTDFLFASEKAIADFRHSLEVMVRNGNRERFPGDFNTALCKLDNIAGYTFAGGAAQDLDVLAAIVTGEGLPIEPECAKDAARQAATLDACIEVEVKIMPARRIHWDNLMPHRVKVRKAHVKDDVFDFYLKYLAINDGPFIEIRYNESGGTQEHYMGTS